MYRSAALLLACASVALADVPGYRADYVEPPRWVVEHRPFQATIRYEVPAGGKTTVRCELKDSRGEVVTQRALPVTASGTQVVSFDAPLAAESPELQLAVWMGEQWQNSACPIVHTRPFAVISATREAELRQQDQIGRDLRLRLSGLRTGKGLVGIYEPTPGGFGTRLAAALKQDGYGVELLTPQLAGNSAAIAPDLFDIVVLADPRVMPVDAMLAASQYVDHGGNLMVLGGPAFEKLLVRLGDRWLPRAEWLDELARTIPVTVKLNFDQDGFEGWRRASNDMTPPSRMVFERPGAAGSAGCVRVELVNQTGWDTFASPTLDQPFGAANTWTSFWAKGDANTGELSVEWDERDGSRWIAVVPLETRWRPYAVPPSSFRFWSGPDGRGGAKDQFKPQNAVRVAIGLADTHTTQTGHGRHVLWFDQLGSAPAPAASSDPQARLGEQAPVTPIDTVSPHYKLFPVTTTAKVVGDPDHLFANAEVPALPAAVTSPHPRPDGAGYKKGRTYRYIPLIETLDKDGLVCGDPATLLLNGAAPGQGGTVVSVPQADTGFFDTDAARRWLVRVADRLTDGLYLYEGGAAYHASFGNESMPVGAVVSNRGRTTRDATVRLTIKQGGTTVLHKAWAVKVPAGASVTVDDAWSIAADAKGSYQVETELVGGRATDRLRHEVRIVRPNAKPSWISAHDGDWWLDGKRWHAMGVNYMPSSGIASEDGPYFERWLSARSYDTAVVDRDLRRLKAIGFNCISVFLYHDDLGARNLLDLLDRCESLGLKVNLSLRPGTPLDFPWPLVEDMVKSLRLAEFDTIFGYDLAWEPVWGTPSQLREWDPEWLAYVDRQYGSLEAAEKAWGVPLPRIDGKPAGPENDQITREGPWKLLVLDYRRFLNELLDRKYGAARHLLKSIDPHHLVSFRMSGAGDPLWGPPMISYDFAGLAKAVDFLAPEGYGRIGDWERVKVGLWTVAYARAVAPDLPVWWAEFGMSTWSEAENAPNRDRLATSAKFYDDFYRMVQLSGSNGTSCWWYPGGYRVGERSDFGILNSDGSWREITRVIAKWAPILKAAAPRRKPDVIITVDPSKDVRGVTGLYEQSQEAFWKAIEAGQVPELKVARP